MKDFLYRSERIKEFRLKKNLTQVEFAKKIVISKGYIAQIETGTRQVTFKLLDKIQVAFNMSDNQIAELIYGGTHISSEETAEEVKPSQRSIDLNHFIKSVEGAIETEDFASFPIQTLDSPTQADGRPVGRVIIHKRVFGRRKNLTALWLDREKETRVVIVGK